MDPLLFIMRFCPVPHLPYRFLVGHHSEETGLDVVIVTHVLVLLLTPDQLSVAIAADLGLDQVKGEWGNLVTQKPKDGSIVGATY